MTERRKGLRIAAGILLILIAVSSLLPEFDVGTMRFQFDLSTFYGNLAEAVMLLAVGILILFRKTRIAGIVLGVYTLYSLVALVLNIVNPRVTMSPVLVVSSVLLISGGVLLALALLFSRPASCLMCLAGAVLRFISPIYLTAASSAGVRSVGVRALVIAFAAAGGVAALVAWFLQGFWFQAQKR